MIRNAQLMFASVAALALMATDSATASAAPKAPKPKTVAEDMDPRRVFDSIAEAETYLNACAANFSDFGDMELAFAGADGEGEFDPEVYTENTRIMVGVLRKVGPNGGVKCIYVLPIPTMAALNADETGLAWVDRIILKELSHVGVRPLRNAEDISTVVDQMPTTRDAFISTARDGGGGIMEAYNDLYKLLSATMGKNSPVWAKFKLTKVELKRALESKAYALEYYPALENRGEGKDSLFVICLKLAVAAASQKGLDPTIFQRWTDTRNDKALAAVEDEESFDIGDMSAAMLAEPDADTPADPTPDAASGPEATA